MRSWRHFAGRCCRGLLIALVKSKSDRIYNILVVSIFLFFLTIFFNYFFCFKLIYAFFNRSNFFFKGVHLFIKLVKHTLQFIGRALFFKFCQLFFSAHMIILKQRCCALPAAGAKRRFSLTALLLWPGDFNVPLPPPLLDTDLFFQEIVQGAP